MNFFWVHYTLLALIAINPPARGIKLILQKRQYVHILWGTNTALMAILTNPYIYASLYENHDKFTQV